MVELNDIVDLKWRLEPCTLRVLGIALGHTILDGPPKYFVGMKGGLEIFDVAHTDTQLLERLRKLQKAYNLSAEEAKLQIGFGKFENGADKRFYDKARTLRIQDVKPQNWYTMEYHPDPNYYV